jgi:O-Antigen ligase
LRRIPLFAAAAVLLVAPTVLAFFSGGYFDPARAWVGLSIWVAVVLAALGGARLPHSRSALVGVGALALLAIWTLLSILWAPIAGNAYHAGQIAVLYLGALLAGALVLRPPVRRFVEPTLALGTVAVIGYGLSERLVPGVLHFARSVSAQGRLEQPLTYWNAMGALAAIGVVLCAGLAGERSRPRSLRSVAAAAVAPLGLGLYISFSRGALFAAFAGLVALLVIRPTRSGVWAVARAVIVATVAALSAATLKGVTALGGSLSAREHDGLVALVALGMVTLLAGLGQLWQSGRERTDELRLPRRAPLIATALICAGLAVAIILGAKDSTAQTQSLASGATRLATLRSNRFNYWSVALRAFGSHPFGGVGAGNWSVYWLRWRSLNEYAQDAHSLELQTLAELGLVGIGLLIGFITAAATAAARAVRAVGDAAAVSCAGVVVYLAHSPLDWDWQMPAVTLVAIVLAGGLLADADLRQSASAIRGASRRNTHTAQTQTTQ